jgi:hypothetical protein
VSANIKKLKIIYIMGDGRSGSTILSIILGNHPDIASVGELHRWPEFQGQTKPGDEKLENKRFWEDILAHYCALGSSPDFENLALLQEDIEDYQQFFKVLLSKDTQDSEAYKNYLKQLFEAISCVADRQIIVDETKKPGRAYKLLKHKDFDTRVIHLVRDPRGVVWSQLKKDVEHKSKHPLTTMAHYNIKNCMGLLVNWLTPNQSILRIRYEDLVAVPEKTLGNIGKFIGISMEPVQQKIRSGESLWVPHLIDGNRIRKKDKINLRFDLEWQRKLTKGWRLVTVFFTLPLFLGFGYWKKRYSNDLPQFHH